MKSSKRPLSNRQKGILYGVLILVLLGALVFSWWMFHSPSTTNLSTGDTTTMNQSVSTPLPKPTSDELFAAVNQKDAATVKALVDRGADLNVQDGEGRTPAMVATYNNDIATAKVLIDAGADVNIRDNMLNNPFLYAGAENQMEILRMTIKAGADPTLLNRYGGTALIPAGEHGHVEIIRELLTTTKIDVNHSNNLGWTALLEAILLNDGGPRQQEAVRTLIQYGADVNKPDSKGVTPLQHARAKGFTEIVTLLRNAGAR